MQKKIEAYIEAHVEEMLADTMALMAINSEKMEEKPGMPFGEGCAEVLAKATEILEGHGFPVKNYDNYVIAADMNENPARLDILAHLDVVPAGTGWTVTEPFCPVIKDGMLYGRGSADDKGPAMAALYAMKAVKELGVELTGNCRLILGSDEECGSSDIQYYFEREQEAPMTFSPDAEFPLINIEKGGLFMPFTAQVEATSTEGIRLVSIQAGTKVNVVPGDAGAVIAGVEEAELRALAATVAEKTGTEVTVEVLETGAQILIKGAFAHAASPEGGNNALTALIELLASVNFADVQVDKLIKNLAKLFPHGDWNGKALGVNHEDKESGKLTLSFNMLNFDGTTFAGIFDCRACICATKENTQDVVAARLTEAGFTPDPHSAMRPPHCVPEDSEFVQTLLSCYEEVTGRKEKPLAIGGGTYVHHIENGVAFGCGDLAVDNRMHGPEEFMDIEQMKKSAVIFALAILKLCQ